MRYVGTLTATKRFWISFFLMLPVALAADLSKTERIQKICADKKTQYGPAYLDCVGYDSGMTPPSASYQPAKDEPMGVSRARLNYLMPNTQYKNPYAGKLKGPDYQFKVHDLNDDGTPIVDNKVNVRGKAVNYDEAPLADRMLDIVENTLPANSPLSQWFHTSWASKFQARPSAPASVGRCLDWSFWALDRDVYQSLQGIQQGIVCKGMPLTLGEIKEIYLTLYSSLPKNSPGLKTLRTDDHFFFGTTTSSGEVTETCNVGLARLGVMGQGSLKPEEMLKQFQTGIDAGKGALMNREHGLDVWNQPVAAMTDTSYKSESDKSTAIANSLLSSADLSPTDSSANSRLLSLVARESEIMIALAAGQPKLYAKADGHVIRDYAAEAVTLVQERSQLIAGGVLKPQNSNAALTAVLHDITVEYTDENEFASNDGDQMGRVSYKYTAAVDAQGRTVKTAWLPPIVKLQDFCKNHADALNAYQKDPNHSQPVLYPGLSAYKVWDDCKSGKNFEVFDGNVPPQYMTMFDAHPAYSGPDAEMKKQAYELFQNMLKSCPVFDHAIEFTEKFMERISDNNLTHEEIDELAPMFKDAEFLDRSWLKTNLCGSGIIGLDALRARLPGFDASICN